MFKNKYGAKKTEIDGIRFDSKAEAEYYDILRKEKLLGLIDELELQPKVYLTDARILYKPDFKITHNGLTWYADVKGVETAVFRIKARLWKHYGPGTLKLVKKKGALFLVSETISPFAPCRSK